MALFEAADPVSAMEDLLARERAAILLGDFPALDKLAREKERMASRLQGAAADPSSFERLRKMSDRNGRLLEATRKGLVDARQKIKALDAPQQLHTYDASGRRTILTQSPKALKKRG